MRPKVTTSLYADTPELVGVALAKGEFAHQGVSFSGNRRLDLDGFHFLFRVWQCGYLFIPKQRFDSTRLSGGGMSEFD